MIRLIRFQPVSVENTEVQRINNPIFIQIRSRVICKPFGIHNAEIYGVDDAVAVEVAREGVIEVVF